MIFMTFSVAEIINRGEGTIGRIVAYPLSFKDINMVYGVPEIQNIIVPGLATYEYPNETFPVALDFLGVEAADVLFVDIYDRNIAIAEGYGIKSVLFRNADQFKNDLKKLGFVFSESAN